MRVFQKGFHYSQDGPGNRMVVHLQGCNMRCPWCSNPEGLEIEGVLITDSQWLEPDLCPHQAVKEGTLDRGVCRTCTDQACINGRRSKGIRCSCEDVEAGKLVQEILSAQMMYYDGGGVTFTGGECTLQYEELGEVLAELKRQGIHTAIETNGTHPKLSELFPYIDYLIMDCKLIDQKKHREITGISNRMILQNIREAARYHPCVHVRVPFIGGVNNHMEEVRRLTAFFQSLPQEHVVFEVLRYHEYGKKKWQECGLKYTMDKSAQVTAEEAGAFRRQLESAGLNYKET